MQGEIVNVTYGIWPAINQPARGWVGPGRRVISLPIFFRPRVGLAYPIFLRAKG